MSHASTGRYVEHLVRDELRRHGWVIAARAAGSRGPADLVALKPARVALVQCKRTQAQLSPLERVALIRLADTLGLGLALPLVASKPLRLPITWRLLTGPGPKDWVAWRPERNAA